MSYRMEEIEKRAEALWIGLGVVDKVFKFCKENMAFLRQGLKEFYAKYV